MSASMLDEFDLKKVRGGRGKEIFTSYPCNSCVHLESLSDYIKKYNDNYLLSQKIRGGFYNEKR